MKKYVQILNGVAHWIFESDTQPQFAPDIIIKELPNDSPVQEGWEYNESTQEFSEPVLPEPIIPEKTAEQIALEIQEKQARDTLIKFDALATLFEDLQENDLNKFEVMASIYEYLMLLEEKINNLGGN